MPTARSTAPARTHRLVSIAVAAEYLATSERTIRRYIADGDLTGYRIGPRLVRLDLNEIDRVLQPMHAGGPR